MALLKSQYWMTLDGYASCVAFHPYKKDIMVVGTYKIKQDPIEEEHGAEDSSVSAPAKPQEREGLLIVLQLNEEYETIRRCKIVLEKAGVLGVDWSPHAGSKDVLAVALSTGAFQLYTLGSDNNLSLGFSYQVAPPTVLVLDLKWHPWVSGAITFTLSSGQVVYMRGVQALSTSEIVSKVVEHGQHDLEAWTIAVSLDGKYIFSGGDDATLQCMDLTHAVPSRLWIARKSHQAGVTSILPLDAELILTGSYDDHIRLFHMTPAGLRRVPLAELDLGGGVWRMKLLRREVRTEAAIEDSNIAEDGTSKISQRYIILASCVFAGVRVVQLTHRDPDEPVEDPSMEGWCFKLLARFEEHKSMNYGSDCFSDDSDVKKIVSTSHYDSKICVWTFNMPAALV